MTVYSVLTIVLITVLATLTTLAIFLGLANGSARSMSCDVANVTI